jgi:hypothetical protein
MRTSFFVAICVIALVLVMTAKSTPIPSGDVYEPAQYTFRNALKIKMGITAVENYEWMKNPATAKEYGFMLKREDSEGEKKNPFSTVPCAIYQYADEAAQLTDLSRVKANKPAKTTWLTRPGITVEIWEWATPAQIKQLNELFYIAELEHI